MKGRLFLKNLCTSCNVDPKDCITVVHEDNDIKMAKISGFTIGFNPSNSLKKYCNIIVEGDDLRKILIPLNGKAI